MNINAKPIVNTYDVFDTLIARRCIFPKYIFHIVERKSNLIGFSKIREDAENYFLKNKHNYNIDDIYVKIKDYMKIDDGIIQNLKSMELQEEFDNCIPIKENIDKVLDGDIIISDMYLPKDFISLLLHKSGLNKKVTLIVSNYGKHHALIWPKIISSFLISKHLGDNEHADGVSPNKYGINYEITKISNVNFFEKILIDMKLEKLAMLIREVRLGVGNEENIIKGIKKYQATYNFPIIFFSCFYLYHLSKKLNKKRIIFSSRDCYLWFNLFNSLFGDEFDCVYYYTSRYAKVSCENDYIKYSNKIITQDSILVDLCGSGYSTERLSHKIKTNKIDCFFIQKMKKDRQYMLNKNSDKLNYHSIINENEEGFLNHKLEIANFAPHPMLKNILCIDDNFFPIFFPDQYHEVEKKYITHQNEIFNKCTEILKVIGVDKIMYELNFEIIGKCLSIFYKFMSGDPILDIAFGENFFKENTFVEDEIKIM
ncbi:hypothetical protein ACQ5TV_12990 [Acetobacter ghanensis]|uniref:hypothetical protein n=1 Tax=Acetobacter ghanensis TaxID=431306 RepID=UPI003D356BA6